MGRFLVRRVGAMTLTILVVLVLNFLLVHMAPGDPIRILSGMDNPSEEAIQNLRHRYGLDKPWPVQFLDYLGNLARGDLGRSIINDEPVGAQIKQKVFPTLLLTVTATALAFVIGTLLGTLSATRYRSKLDSVLSFITYVLYAMPAFWLGLMMILLFAGWLKIFPTSGMVSLRVQKTGAAYAADMAWHLTLPAITLALVQVPVYYRITRASVVQVLKEDFVTTLKATGMPLGKIFRKYALRNAILPTITMLGLQLGYVVTGAALVEIVFAWPGMGRMTLDAVFRRDYPLLMGIYLMISISVAVAIFLTDLVYGWLDPRIRYS
jgi:peptide/nickel transport system permease protein